MRPTRALWLAVAGAVLAGVGIVAFPTMYIMPFRAQRADILQWALVARTYAPLVSAVAAAVAAVLVALLVARTGRRRWIQATVALLAMAPLLTAAWFARQNHFEWMFNPLQGPRYVTAAKATFVDPADVVMAVTLKGEAVAYPIRQLAYHHVVNDVIAGEPIVATY
jgi:hypothetical protein